MPCNVDIATQEILKLAETADPDGVRTMGVLTKPDLATERATQDAVIDLVLGKRNPLKLGYWVVKNRSADDETSTLAERLSAEKAFFMSPQWSNIMDRCGVISLQNRLRGLLMEISKQEFPHVKFEVDKKLRQCRSDLEAMGPSRSDQSSQRLFLGKVASRFQAVTQCALNGYYSDDSIFETHPYLKLSTEIMEQNERFSNDIMRRGHKQRVYEETDEDAESEFSSNSAVSRFNFTFNCPSFPELDDIINLDPYECPEPEEGDVVEHVKTIYKSSRGPEIGTVRNSSLF
jgi:hypothetical protein